MTGIESSSARCRSRFDDAVARVARRDVAGLLDRHLRVAGAGGEHLGAQLVDRDRLRELGDEERGVPVGASCCTSGGAAAEQPPSCARRRRASPRWNAGSSTRSVSLCR